MMKDLREDMLEQQREREEKKGKPEEGLRSARMLRTMGIIIVVLGVFFGVIGICGSESTADGLFIFLVIILPAFAIWAFAMAVADIAENSQKMVDNTYVIANNTYMMANKGEKPQEPTAEPEA